MIGVIRVKFSSPKLQNHLVWTYGTFGDSAEAGLTTVKDLCWAGPGKGRLDQDTRNSVKESGPASEPGNVTSVKTLRAS